ncbi:hypothetical protein AB6A40_009659 [Gnathostoma spinigerum]|uniref:Helicase ATP-binding domain-containing protein n=1 Tax=Gnathostoma spinigerum TaxID=75299 RepID=A0ABD6F1Y1_9BILA
MCNQSENELSIQLAIMDLYCEDLKKQFEIGYKETDCFSILLPANALNQLKLDCKLDLSRFSSELWRLLFHAPTRGGLYQSVIHFVSLFGRKTSDLLCKLQLNSSANVRCLLTLALKEYNRLLSVMNPYVVMDKLSDMDATYAVVLNDIAMKSDLRNLSRTSLIKSILQCLPIFGLDSWWNLLYAIQCQGSDGEEYVNSVVPKFSYFYERLRMERDEVDSSGPVFVVDKNCSISDAVLQSASKNCCFKVNLQYDLFPSLSKANCDSARGEPLFLRSYQEELAEPARNGENTIVCAPTGCGKTLVAVDIIQKHLIEGYSRKESRKVCFLVTNTTFLEQQTNVLKKYLEYRWIVKGISGATVSSTPVADIIRSVDVIVLTPQLLINTLEMKDPLNFSSFFSLSTFTLLVFDEAHHTNDNHPYNVIMDKYHCLKERGLIISGVHPFQILGMTASLGIGKAKTAEDAVKHIISICANMDISVISRVRKNVGDLCKFSGMTSDSIKLVETAHKHHELFHIFNDYMKKLEEILLDTKFSESSIHTPEGTSFLLDANPLQPPKAGRDSQGMTLSYVHLSLSEHIVGFSIKFSCDLFRKPSVFSKGYLYCFFCRL